MILSFLFNVGIKKKGFPAIKFVQFSTLFPSLQYLHSEKSVPVFWDS